MSSCKRLRILLITGLGLFIISPSYATPPQDISLLKRVRDYWAEGDFSLAKKQITQYLEENPQSDLLEELSALLGDAYMQEGNFTSALLAYDNVHKTSLCKKTAYNRAICLYETKQTEELFSTLEQTGASFLSAKQYYSLSYLCACRLFEEKIRLDEAISLASRCEQSELRTPALFLLSNILRTQGNLKQAALCYLTLAKELPNQEPSLLFEAACLFSSNTPEKALSLFTKLSSCAFPKQGESVYNVLLLQSQLQHYREVVLFYEANHKLLSEERELSSLYLVGKSLYQLRDYDQAYSKLSQFLERSNLPSSSKDEIFLILLDSLARTDNLSAYEEILQKALAQTSSLSTYEDASYTRLQLLHSQGKKKDFLLEAERFLTIFPLSSYKENLSLQTIHVLYEAGEWEKADTQISSFQESFPSSLHHNHLLRLQVNCAGLLVKNSSQEALFAHRNRLIQVEENALIAKEILSAEEREKIFLELAKNLFLSNKYIEALSTIELFQQEFPLSFASQEAKRIKTFCYLKTPNNLPLFVSEAEGLLEASSTDPEQVLLSTHLFNAYVDLDLHDKAAELLYTLFSQRKSVVDQENIEWLADYYYLQASTSQEAINRSISLFSLSLSTSSNTEAILYKLSDLLTRNGEYQKKAEILENWLLAHPFSGSIIQKNLLLDLANTQKTLNNTSRALALYDILIRSCSSSQIGFEALFQRCKILFSALPETNKTETNPEYIAILDQLKNLENLRLLDFEPLQLEAALTYIEYRVAPLQESELKNQKTKDLLENFLQHPALLFAKHPTAQAYKRLVQAEILLLEKQPDEAISLLSSLQSDSFLPSLLQERISHTIQGAKNSL